VEAEPGRDVRAAGDKEAFCAPTLITAAPPAGSTIRIALFSDGDVNAAGVVFDAAPLSPDSQ
jgi:hypothetical protein